MDLAVIDLADIDLATVSLIALVVVIVVSCTTAVNPGVLAIVLAGIVGLYLAPLWGESFTVDQIARGFPVDLFLTLVGVTLLFGHAQANGTLDRVAHAAVRCCRGNVGLIPLMFFVLTAALASIGPGNIAASALVAPMAMPVAARAGIPPLVMTLMVAHGAIAGAMSPFAPTGLIANRLIREELHVVGFEWSIYLHNLLANAAVALAGYVAFGGLRLFRKGTAPTTGVAAEPSAAVNSAYLQEKDEAGDPLATLYARHWITLAAIAALIGGKIVFNLDVGLGAFTAAVLLTLCRLGDEKEALRRIPWGVILMVCGVTVLIKLLEQTGGLKLFSDMIASVSTPETAPAVIAFATGLVSVYSSTSGVVLPAFLPLVPDLLRELGGEPLNYASTMVIGGHLVDSSPLSTIGAICVASAPIEERQRLFVQTMIWGLSMCVVGAVGCYLVFGVLA